MVKIWDADDADLLWQNADGDGFTKAKADGGGFFGTRIGEIRKIFVMFCGKLGVLSG